MAVTTKRPYAVTPARQAATEAKLSFNFDLKRRLTDQRKILSADDLSGLYEAGRGLFTTLSGQPKIITYDDLKQFRYNVKQFRSKVGRNLGGITPKHVIDWSAKEDRDRAQNEIRTGLPVSSTGGKVLFQTNAGPNSDRLRHQVYVEFLNYNAAVASPKSSSDMAPQMTKGPVRFDCSCGRHTFWYRYIATIGGWNFGRAEDGFPKVRNPKLIGVACKHVLRVMAIIHQSPTFKGYVAKMIDRARTQLQATRKDVKVKEMEQLAKDIGSESHRQRRVYTTEEKRLERARYAKTPKGKALINLQSKALAKAKKKSEKDVGKARSTVENNITKLLGLGAINKAQADAMLKALRGG